MKDTTRIIKSTAPTLTVTMIISNVQSTLVSVQNNSNNHYCYETGIMFSSFNFSWNLSSDVSTRCSSHPQGENG